MYKNFIKPIVDKVIAFVAFLLLSPVLLITTILLYCVNQGEPFFFQLRPGVNGKIFKIIKFKTMNDKKDQDGNLLSDNFRLTNIGKFVR